MILKANLGEMVKFDSCLELSCWYSQGTCKNVTSILRLGFSLDAVKASSKKKGRGRRARVAVGPGRRKMKSMSKKHLCIRENFVAIALCNLDCDGGVFYPVAGFWADMNLERQTEKPKGFRIK